MLEKLASVIAKIFSYAAEVIFRIIKAVLVMIVAYIAARAVDIFAKTLYGKK